MCVCLYVLLTCHLAQLRPQGPRNSFKPCRPGYGGSERCRLTSGFFTLPDLRNGNISLCKPSQAHVLFFTVRSWGPRNDF